MSNISNKDNSNKGVNTISTTNAKPNPIKLGEIDHETDICMQQAYGSDWKNINADIFVQKPCGDDKQKPIVIHQSMSEDEYETMLCNQFTMGQ